MCANMDGSLPSVRETAKPTSSTMTGLRSQLQCSMGKEFLQKQADDLNRAGTQTSFQTFLSLTKLI